MLHARAASTFDGAFAGPLAGACVIMASQGQEAVLTGILSVSALAQPAGTCVPLTWVVRMLCCVQPWERLNRDWALGAYLLPCLPCKVEAGNAR